MSEIDVNDLLSPNLIKFAGEGTSIPIETHDVKESDVVSLIKTDQETLSGQGFTYRHDWGNRHGTWRLNLNWGSVNRNSRVFVSTSEGAPGNQMFIGSAWYTIHNVAPRDGGVDIRVHIGWDSNIRITVNYLVINP